MQDRSTSPGIRLDRTKLLGFAPPAAAKPQPRDPRRVAVGGKPAPLLVRDPRRLAAGGKPAPHRT